MTTSQPLPLDLINNTWLRNEKETLERVFLLPLKTTLSRLGHRRPTRNQTPYPPTGESRLPFINLETDPGKNLLNLFTNAENTDRVPLLLEPFKGNVPLK